MSNTVTHGKVLANFLINDFSGMLRKRGLSIAASPIKPEAIGFLARMVHAGHLPKRKMRELVERWIDNPVAA